ncbi:MAG: HEAT repeat domain-containing protein [Planctomycetes bacterium]|nr:HEAT repeat domain-containing protein [Planctomycetota bacterium]
MNSLSGGVGRPFVMAACVAVLLGAVGLVAWSNRPADDRFASRLGQPPLPNALPARSEKPPASSPPARPTPSSLRRDRQLESLQDEIVRLNAELDRLRSRRSTGETRAFDWSDALAALDAEASSLLSHRPNESFRRPAIPTPIDPALMDLQADGRGFSIDGSGDRSTATNGSGSAPPAGDAAQQIAELRRRLEIAAFLDEQQTTEIERLERELNRLRADNPMERELREALELERRLHTTAARTLVQMGEPAVPALTDALADESPAVRQWAAEVLGAMGAGGRGARSALLDALSDPDPGVRDAAATALELLDGEEE